MTTNWTRLIVLVALCQPVSAVAGQLPVFEATDLAGEPRSLPDGLEGEVNLLLVAFEQAQKADTDTWLPTGASLYEEFQGFSYYGLPVLPKSLRMMRPLVEAWMKSRITDPVARRHVVALYVERAEFRAAVGLPEKTGMALLLVDRLGRVRWTGLGRWSAETEASLRVAVAGLLPQRPGPRAATSPE